MNRPKLCFPAKSSAYLELMLILSRYYGRIVKQCTLPLNIPTVSDFVGNISRTAMINTHILVRLVGSVPYCTGKA